MRWCVGRVPCPVPPGLGRADRETRRLDGGPVVSAEPLDLLLAQLASGEAAAAAQVFQAYEPYLRMVVRPHLSPPLRSKFASLDIIQFDVLVRPDVAGEEVAGRV